jgi:hypothetical protein
MSIAKMYREHGVVMWRGEGGLSSEATIWRAAKYRKWQYQSARAAASWAAANGERCRNDIQ